MDSKITGEFGAKLDKSMKLTEDIEKAETPNDKSGNLNESVNTAINQNKKEAFIEEIPDEPIKDVLREEEKAAEEKKKLLADQKDIQRK